MKILEQQLQNIKRRKKIGVMTHVVVGYPSLEASYQVVKQMVAGGADIIELQIPFSDPLADGPTIMRANDLALRNHVTTADCLQFIQQVSANFEIPFLLMGYYNSIYQFGLKEFCRAAVSNGCQGLIIPDIPLDEEIHEGFIKSCQEQHLHHIRLLSPTSTAERIRLNAEYQNGFVYCTTRCGTTGVSKQLDPSVVSFLHQVKKQIHIPVAVGFGISQPEHVRALVGQAEIAVVGSAVIEQIAANGIESVQQLIEQLTVFETMKDNNYVKSLSKNSSEIRRPADCAPVHCFKDKPQDLVGLNNVKITHFNNQNRKSFYE